MKNYELIIFDLDGTLADTSEGIYNAHKYTNVQMGRQEPSEEELNGIIGSPLLETYVNRFGYEEIEAKKAVTIYRDWYRKYGVNEAKLYNDISEMLQVLRQQNYKLAVATLKAENLAKDVLHNLNIAHFFEVIHGVDGNDTRSKCDLINMCVEGLKCNREKSVLVGDSVHDLLGAKEAGIDFIAAVYGFGSFKNEQVSEDKRINEPFDLLNIL